MDESLKRQIHEECRIRNCRTAEMGAHVSECESCHSTYIHYNSCKDRHCPMCQGMNIDEWINLRREDVLDAPYFHTVFSIPSQLYALVYSNQKLLYDALYHPHLHVIVLGGGLDKNNHYPVLHNRIRLPLSQDTISEYISLKKVSEAFPVM